MDFAAVVVIQVLYAIASLALISIGLAIIFGMMRVINFAHGEFLMLGGYATVLPTHAGINLWFSMLVIAPTTSDYFGIVVERLIIRPLYGRIVETVLATWGLSLLLIGVVSSVIGFYQEGAAPPFGSVLIGTYHVSIVYALCDQQSPSAILLGVYLFLKFTHYGLIAQGTMQNDNMAAALGVNVDKVYAITFGLGAALSGLAGAILAPISGVIPIIGITYIAKAFIVVVGGGVTVLAGTTAASVFFGTISQLVTFATTPIIGEVALLAAAVVLLSAFAGRNYRSLLPEGLVSSRLEYSWPGCRGSVRPCTRICFAEPRRSLRPGGSYCLCRDGDIGAIAGAGLGLCGHTLFRSIGIFSASVVMRTRLA